MTRGCNIAVGFEAGAAIEVTTEPEALAKVLSHSLIRSDLAEIGTRGRELVASRFTWPAIVSELRAVYAWLADRGPRPSCVRLN
jgi:poly(glycerol-phosphate) alpha-glucosyltransferase